jgi:hypothetical protein
MLARLLLGLLADLVFESAAAASRSYPDELGRYLERRGFDKPSRRRLVTD